MRRLVIPMLAITLSSSSALAQEFPADDQWWPLECGDVLSFDPVADEPGATADRDIVGDSDAPAMWAFSDDDHFFFRMRIDADPTRGVEFNPFAWGVVLDTDEDRRTYELLVQLDGGAGEVTLRKNTMHASLDDPGDPAEELVTSWPVETHARAVPAEGDFDSNFAGDEDWFIDFAADRRDLAAENVGDTTPLAMLMGTSSNARSLDADIACNRAGTDDRTLSGSTSDRVDADGNRVEEGGGGQDALPEDTDGDGYSDDVERRAGTDPEDPADVPGFGIRGGPAGCSHSSAVGDPSWMLLLALFALVRRPRRARESSRAR